MRPDPCLSPFTVRCFFSTIYYHATFHQLNAWKRKQFILSHPCFPLVHPFLVVVFLFSQTVICPMKNHADYEFKISIAQQTMYDKQVIADDMFRAMKSNPFEKLINLRGNENSFGLSRVRVIKGLSSAVKITTNK